MSLLVVACGGGGSSGGPDVRVALQPLSQDTDPSGDRLDYRSRNYFPMGDGDAWSYDVQRNGVSTGMDATRRVSVAANGDALLTEYTPDDGNSTDTYRRTADGWVIVAPLKDVLPAAVVQQVGDVLEYPEPFYAIGSTRRVVRQGSWGTDGDGDGVPESWRFERTQVLAGIGSLTLPSGTLQDVAHFTNVSQLTLQPSDKRQAVVTLTVTEEVWWAPGIGLVRAERSATDSTGVAAVPAYTLVLKTATVGGVNALAPKPEGSLTKVALTHSALVYDPSRNLYYASIPGSVLINGNRIATINPSTGEVTYAQPVGSEPGPLALAKDGSALYVGLNGSGEVAKLRLPDLAEQWRVRLPASTWYGQLQSERIAVSPVNANVVAVSLMRVGISPRHGGVALIRGGVVQPTMTQEHTGSNLIAFDGSGQYVYGFNNETTEFGLRRLAVLDDGLREDQVVSVTSAGFITKTLEWSADGLSVGRAVYKTPGLTLTGQVGVATSGCRFAAVANRLVCATGNNYDGQGMGVAVIDATSLVLLAMPAYAPGYAPLVNFFDLVPGPAGQVALRISSDYYGLTNSVWLFNSPSLP